MTAAAQTPNALDDLDRLDEAAINLGRRRQEVEDALLLIGRRGRPQNATANTPMIRASGKLGEVGAAIRNAHGQAARDGVAADVADLEAQVADLERERDGLRGELDALAVEERRLHGERVALLHGGHGAFAENQRAIAAEGDELRRVLADAAHRVLAHQPKVQNAARLAVAGLTRDDAARATYLRGAEPWLGRTGEAGEYWRAVERVAMQVEP